jgi:putative membrane protein
MVLSRPGPRIASHHGTALTRFFFEVFMKLRTLTLCLATAGAFAVSTGVGAQTMSTQSRSVTATSSKLTSRDKSFLENAAQAGNAEIAGSKIAQTQAMSPDVKTFADKMIQDHTKVGDDLTALALKKGYTPPTDPSLVQSVKLKTLGLMKGARFDRMYASQIGVSAHQDAVKLFKREARRGNDPDIKAFAADHVAALQGHLSMATTLKAGVANEK